MNEYPKRVEVRCYHSEKGTEQPLCVNCKGIQEVYEKQYQTLLNSN